MKREIEVNDNISIVVKQDEKIDLVTANAEAMLIQKIAKAVEGFGVTVKGLKKTARQVKPQNGYHKYTDAEAKALVTRWDNASEKERLKIAEEKGYPANSRGLKLMGSKISYLAARAPQKTAGKKTKKRGRSATTWNESRVKRLREYKKKGVKNRDIANKLGLTRKQVNDKVSSLRGQGVRI